MFWLTIGSVQIWVCVCCMCIETWVQNIGGFWGWSLVEEKEWKWRLVFVARGGGGLNWLKLEMKRRLKIYIKKSLYRSNGKLTWLNWKDMHIFNQFNAINTYILYITRTFLNLNNVLLHLTIESKSFFDLKQ